MSCGAEVDDHWSYDDWTKWSEHFPSAAGSAQSPIDIPIDETVAQSYSPFIFSADCLNPVLLTLTNNGHQVAATLAKNTDGSDPADLNVQGGGLEGIFHFVNFHLHWGRNDRHGSEHEVDSDRYAAEGHFVFKNRDTEQTAVFAFFFHIAQSRTNENFEWKKYADTASLLTNIGATANGAFNLSELMNINSKRFFRYNGSLTTPPCTEGVIWTVFSDRISIMEEDLNLLRQNLMRKVYRPVQPVNDRVIYRSYDDE